jgi:hypothetical protein
VEKNRAFHKDFLLLAGIFLALAALTWRRWGYPWGDAGYQPYAAWQIAQGKVLYRDLFSWYGPLSQYVNGALFRGFGVSLSVLIYANLALVALLTGLIYRFFSAASGRAGAAAASFSFLFLFAFAQNSYNGSYNYVLPYSQEAVHGVLLGVLMLFCLSRALEKPRWTDLSAAGLCLGLSFLTKPEFFLALLLPALIFLFFMAGRKQIIPLFLPALIPPLLFLIYFSRHMPWSEAVRAVAGAWDLHFIQNTSQSPFYLRGSGLDEPVENFLKSLFSFIFAGAVLAGLVSLDYRFKDKTPKERLVPLLWAVMSAVLLAVLVFPDGFCALLWILPAIAGALILRRRHPKSEIEKKKSERMILWAFFAFALLFKMLFRARLYHYGFVLAMPAFLFCAVFLLETLPGWLHEKYGGGGFLRSAFFIFLISIFFHYGFRSAWLYSQKNLPVGEGGDRIYASSDSFDKTMRQAAEWLEKNAPADAKVSLLPLGHFINYLTRRPDPTHYGLFVFLGGLSDGERKVLEDLRDSRPDYIVLVPHDWQEYGALYYGEKSGFGKEVVDWVRQTYKMAAQFEAAEPGKADRVLEIYSI